MFCQYWSLSSQRALGPREVRVVVLDISLPTGFTAEHSDLEKVLGLDYEINVIKFKFLQSLRRVNN